MNPENLFAAIDFFDINRVVRDVLVNTKKTDKEKVEELIALFLSLETDILDAAASVGQPGDSETSFKNNTLH